MRDDPPGALRSWNASGSIGPQRSRCLDKLCRTPLPAVLTGNGVNHHPGRENRHGRAVVE
jgi:hypothetical protein